MGKKTNIRNYDDIRTYLREYYLDAFKSLDEYGKTTTRYNKRDQIMYMLGDFFDESGKVPSLVFDSRNERHNPLYKTFKFKQITKESLRIHFALLSRLAKTNEVTIESLRSELELIDVSDEDDIGISRQTIQNLVNEYVRLGILEELPRNAEGKRYRLADSIEDLDSWKAAVGFFAEVSPLGLIGSYLLDRYGEEPETKIRQKHNFMFPALDSLILYDLLAAMRSECSAAVRYINESGAAGSETRILPLRLMVSTENGRQYFFAYDYAAKTIPRRPPGVSQECGKSEKRTEL